MTAIYALWDRSGDDVSDLARSYAQISRRYGPKPIQPWSAGSVILGKALFPLLPEDKFSDSLDTSTTRWVVTADVRLTERDDLAAQLNLDPDSASDSIIVSQAIERWGKAAFDKIYGSFAIIAWDTQEHTLLLARDALGERPLYYFTDKKRAYAASMPDILLSDPDIKQEADIEQYKQLLRMNSFAPGRSGFININVVRPGHCVTLTDKHAHEDAWWKPDLSPLKLKTQAEYEALVSQTLDAAVNACLRRASGKVGTHLSSGFDSTAVATTAAKIMAPHGERITAFVAAPRDGPVQTMTSLHVTDETHLAECTAAMHHNMDLIRVVPRSGPLTALSRARALYASPIVNLCNLPWFEEINDAARDRNVTVLLHGLWGNTTISESGVWALRELARQGRFIRWGQIGYGLVRGGWMRWRGVLFNTVENMLPDTAWQWATTLSGRTVEKYRDGSLLTEEAYKDAANAHYQAAVNAGEPAPDISELGREKETSVNFRLSTARTNGDGDQYKAMLAEWGLDLRDPTADRRLFELSLRIPVERLVWKGEPRAILRRILADRAPPEVLNNRQRGYQGADWAQAICQDRSAFIAEMERLELYQPTAEFLDSNKIRKLIDDLPDDNSAEWDSEYAENTYRVACLFTISAASHMRHVARSNM